MVAVSSTSWWSQFRNAFWVTYSCITWMSWSASGMYSYGKVTFDKFRPWKLVELFCN